MNEELVRDCLRMYRERENYYQNTINNGKSLNLDVDYAVAGAYHSAAMMLEYALQDNVEILRQFDYYGEEK